MDLLLGSVLLAGFLSFFSPCTIPMIPVYIGILTGEQGELKKIGPLQFSSKALLRTTLFVLGLSAVFVTMGFGAGFLGTLLYNPWFFRVLGLIVILLGLKQLGLLRLSFLDRERRMQTRVNPSGYAAPFLLGLTFSFGWTPCVGPVLGMILGVSSTGGPVKGAFYMFIYSIGLMLPFLFITLFSSYAMSKVEFLEKHAITIQRVGGVLIILMGILLMSNKLSLLAGGI